MTIVWIAAVSISSVVCFAMDCFRSPGGTFVALFGFRLVVIPVVLLLLVPASFAPTQRASATLLVVAGVLMPLIAVGLFDTLGQTRELLIRYSAASVVVVGLGLIYLRDVFVAEP